MAVSQSLTALEATTVALAGVVAGGINAVLGSGTLVTFPVLIAYGYSPVVANVSNNIGLVPGTIGGIIGYRRELDGQGVRARTLALGSGAGAALGGTLLLTLPSRVFDSVVPVLILLACVLLALQPRLTRVVVGRRRADARDVGAVSVAATFLAGIYGGYFGAAQGIILVAVLGALVPDALARTTALKNVLAGVVNLVAAVLFVVVADVAWDAVALIGAGSAVGALVGANLGRRVPARILRPIFVAFGVAVAAFLILR
ncbi:MAG TPA: sulfite exporter TauE/SafE family protein [Acidimicrobiales bacterium]|nr:sulfite exporter TauE/SafE family protein [Acidimicrobiales bacterium]